MEKVGKLVDFIVLSMEDRVFGIINLGWSICSLGVSSVTREVELFFYKSCKVGESVGKKKFDVLLKRKRRLGWVGLVV